MPHPGFHNKIVVDGEFPPEKGRYVLYASLSCPFVHRTLISYALKGLGDCIKVIYVHPIQAHLEPGTDKRTWVFGGNSEYLPESIKKIIEENKDKEILDVEVKQWLHNINPENTNVFGFDTTDPLGHKTVQELYENSDSTYDGRWTVPVLYCTKTKKIVNSESAEICDIFDSAFDEWATNPSWTMNPKEVSIDIIKSRIDNDWSNVILPLYKFFGIKNQLDHFAQSKVVFENLSNLNEHLSKNRFATGKNFTNADIRLVVALLRVDPVQIPLFRLPIVIERDFPHIQAYLRDIYQNVFNDLARSWWAPEQSLIGAWCSYGSGIAPLLFANSQKTLLQPVDRASL